MKIENKPPLIAKIISFRWMTRLPSRTSAYDGNYANNKRSQYINQKRCISVMLMFMFYDVKSQESFRICIPCRLERVNGSMGIGNLESRFRQKTFRDLNTMTLLRFCILLNFQSLDICIEESICKCMLTYIVHLRRKDTKRQRTCIGHACPS